MLTAMDELAPEPQPAPRMVARRMASPLAGVSGCLLLAVWTSPVYDGSLSFFIETPSRAAYHGLGWIPYVVVPTGATILGLCALRWWPYLLLVAGALAVPETVRELTGTSQPFAVTTVCQAGYPLAVIGILACAQGLTREARGWGAAIAGLVLGSRLFGAAILGAGWMGAGRMAQVQTLPSWHAALIAAGLLGLLPAAWWNRRGDRAAEGTTEDGRWSWRRIRLVLASALAMCLVVPLSLLLTSGRLVALFGVSWAALYRHEYVVTAMMGALMLLATTVIVATTGAWPLAVALIAATTQVAVAAPMILVVAALGNAGPIRWISALIGVVLGGVMAASHRRIPLAGTLALAAAGLLFIAYAATTGYPEKLAEQQVLIPASAILILVTAAATALVGSTAPVLAPRGALPAVLGPMTGVLATGGLQALASTYLTNGVPVSSTLNPAHHVTTSAVLLLAAGVALGGLGLAQHLAERRAERQTEQRATRRAARRQAERIRQEAAAAERDRLARPIHDGVLQVLAMVQRHGSDLDGPGAQLAALAGEQEVALRSLLSGGSTTRPNAQGDLGMLLRALASPTVEVTAPAEPVVLPARPVAELMAAVQAALDNVCRHAGPTARAWVLLEDEHEAVRVTVRDNGVGFPPQRLVEAAEAGRLGVVQSMRGRIDDLNGTTTIDSRPGEGTEVEFWVPR